jgi:helix-turn-helix protein
VGERPHDFTVIASRAVIGDTHEEIIESLSRLVGTDIDSIVLHRQSLAMNNQN